MCSVIYPDSVIEKANICVALNSFGKACEYNLIFYNYLVATHFKRPVIQSFDIYFVVSLNKMLNKPLSHWWFTILIWSGGIVAMKQINDIP